MSLVSGGRGGADVAAGGQPHADVADEKATVPEARQPRMKAATVRG
jgi:hypothetical protein